MADIYVRSTDGSDTDNGSTWALAKATLAGAIAIAVAGDRILISQAHAESSSSSLTYVFPGTLAAPNQVLCVNDAAQPPTSLATGASITTTGATQVAVQGNVFVHGLTFNCGSGSSSLTPGFNVHAVVADAAQVYEDCTWHFVRTHSGNTFSVGTMNSGHEGVSLTVRRGTFRFTNTGQVFSFSNGNVRVERGSFDAATTTPSVLFRGAIGNHKSRLLVQGLDCTNLGTSIDLVQNVGSGSDWVLRNCKLPPSWAGSLVAGTKQAGSRVEMHNCDSGDTSYRLWVEPYAGSIKSETTIVRTGGASDGTTPLSWRMTTGTAAIYPLLVLSSPELVRWNETLGGAITVGVEVVHDAQGAGSGGAFQDDELWLDVQYLGTSGFPISSFVSDAKASVLASAADQTTSTEVWTTTGLTTPVKQRLSVTFTPQEKGYIHARVMLAKASKTVYIDHKPVVT